LAVPLAAFVISEALPAGFHLRVAHRVRHEALAAVLQLAGLQLALGDRHRPYQLPALRDADDQLLGNAHGQQRGNITLCVFSGSSPILAAARCR
jgi:hypothetical protein